MLTTDSRVMGSQYTSISDVNVTLTISGGYNGDLYGYLVHSSGYTVLLNRVGTTSGDPDGYGDAGFSNITLDDSATADIHLYGGGFVPTGSSWQPDGRNVGPAVVTSGAPRDTSLASFNGLDPHGSWTLFFADNSLGEQSTLVSWGLEINAVPEPVTWALMIFGGLAGGIQLVRRFVVRKPE